MIGPPNFLSGAPCAKWEKRLTRLVVFGCVPKALLERSKIRPCVINELVEVVDSAVRREFISVGIDDRKAGTSPETDFRYGGSSRHISVNTNIGRPSSGYRCKVEQYQKVGAK